MRIPNAATSRTGGARTEPLVLPLLDHQAERPRHFPDLAVVRPVGFLENRQSPPRIFERAFQIALLLQLDAAREVGFGLPHGGGVLRGRERERK